MNNIKESFANMQGLEWVSWFVLKPIAVILTVITFIILQGLSDEMEHTNSFIQRLFRL